MPENPSPIDGVKKSIEYIIGADTKLKRKKKSEDDIQKEQFIKLITSLEEVNNRSILMNTEFNLNFTAYDEKFYEAIDSLISMHFGPDAAELVFYYLYDRVNLDGTINNLLDENKNKIEVENAGDLWDLIKELKTKIEQKKK